MHPTSKFHWADRAEMLSFVGGHGFATFVDASLRVAQAPVIVDERSETIQFHLSRRNPIARDMPIRVVAVLGGVDGYVSPDWYAEEDQVPTWNYESVEIVGTLAPTNEPTLLSILARLSAKHEGRIAGKAPWTMDKLSAATLRSLVDGIVGVSLSIESIRGTQKLSQNKPSADVAGVIAGLHGRRPSDIELAARMALQKR